MVYIPRPQARVCRKDVVLGEEKYTEMRKVSCSLAFALLVSCSFADSLSAADPDADTRLATLEREVAELKAQSGTSSGTAATEDCPCPTWETGAELTLLRPEIGSLAIHNFIQNEFDVTPSYDLDAAFRVWIGREAANGLGWRVSFWQFKDSASLQFPSALENAVLDSDLNLYAVDFEVTRRVNFCGWDVLGSMGVRVGGVDTSASVSTTTINGAINDHFTGAGLTCSLASHQALGQSNWSVYGGFRGSLMYGMTRFDMNADITQFITFNGGLSGTIADQTVAAWEMQLGLQYERCTRYGLLFGRAGVEAQLWQLPPVIAGIGDQSIGLLGPVFAIGLSR